MKKYRERGAGKSEPKERLLRSFTIIIEVVQSTISEPSNVSDI